VIGPVVTLDGPAGAGKSTVAREVARRLGYRHLDTGALYRAVTVLALRRRIAPDDEGGLAALAGAARIEFDAAGRIRAEGEDLSREIRSAAVTSAVSAVARHPAVRAAILPLQRAFASGGGMVAEGRDLGTVVFPDATTKVFLDATLPERAERRARELARPEEARRLEAELSERDRQDSERETAPLKLAPDMIYVDTTGLTIEEVSERIVVQHRARLGRSGTVG
jgi:cytidylate kinase